MQPGEGRAPHAAVQRRVYAASAAASLNESLQAVHERGEKLSELGDKSQQLADNASDFLDLAKQLRKQNERPFFGFF